MASLRARGPHVAETDGTPRYRKSKPPKGAGTRNSRPSAKAKKRAALRDTLPSGSTLDPSRDTRHTSQDDKVTPVAGVDLPDLANANSVVRTTMPKMIRSEEPHEAADMRRTSPRSTSPLAGGTPGPQPRTIRSSLGSTLRMELTVHKGEGSEPHIQLRSTAPLGQAGRSEAPPSASSIPHEPENPMRARKPTTPGFAPAFPDPSARPARFETSSSGAADGGHVRFQETLRRGGDYEAPARPARSLSTTSPSLSTTSPSMSTTGAGNTQRPRRPRRPGERTLIMSRKVKTGSKRDWVFVVLLVAALGLTASMFLSQQAPSDEVVDAAAYEDPQYQEEADDPFAPTTLRPWHARDNARDNANGAADQRQSDTNALTAREANAAANSVQATELKSLPAGAEVLVGNAVVGSTPVRVARGSTDIVYVLRLAGHESKVVRVGPNSPPSILVQLGPLAPATPPPTLGEAPAAPSGTP